MPKIASNVAKIPEEYIDAAHQYLIAQVACPAWDSLAKDLGADSLAQSTHERLADLTVMSTTRLNLRGLFGGREWQARARQAFDYHDPAWDVRLGLPGISDPDSEISQKMMQSYGELGLTEPTEQAREVQPSIIGALGCFGISNLHRAQKQHGRELSVVGPDGSYVPETPLNEDPHPAMTSDKTLFVALGSFRPLIKELGEHEEVYGFAPNAVNEFDLTLAASRWVTKGRCVEEYRQKLPDVGYETNGETGLMVVQELDNGSSVLNICAPHPALAPGGRAQTPHTYMALQKVLEMRDIQTRQQKSDTMALVTNVDYATYQRTAAINAFMAAAHDNVPGIPDGCTSFRGSAADTIDVRSSCVSSASRFFV